MKKILLITAFILAFFKADLFSQTQQKIDSLKNLLPSLNEDTSLIKSYIYIRNASLYVSKSDEKLYSKKALDLAKAINWEKYIATACMYYGTALLHEAKRDSAIYYTKQAMVVWEKLKNTRAHAVCYANIGQIYTTAYDYKNAIYYNKIALEKILPLGDNNIIGGLYSNLALNYKNINDNANALRCNLESLKIKEAEGNEINMLLGYNNVTEMYYTLNDWPNVLVYSKKGIDLGAKLDNANHLQNLYRVLANSYFNMSDKDAVALKIDPLTKREKGFTLLNTSMDYAKKLEDKTFIANVWSDLADVHKKDKNYDKALELLNKVLEVDKEYKDELNIGKDKAEIADILFLKKQYKEAEILCKEALKVGNQKNNKELKADVYRILNLVYKEIGNYEMSLSHLKKYNEVRDSLYNDSTKTAIINEQVKFDYDKKSIADSNVNETEKAVINTKLKSESRNKWLFASLALLAFALGALIYKFYVKKKKTNEQLNEINAKINKQNNTLKTLNTELIESEEKLTTANNSKEQLISMMSHDLLNPITAITNYNQQIISKKTSNEDLLQAFKTVDAAIQPMHGLLDNMLQWTAIQKDGIKAKLKNQDVNEIVKEIISIYRPQANLKFIKINDALQDEFVMKTDKSILSLILRNLLNNAIKYSGNDTSILVTTNATENTITIQDEGFGMTDEMIGYLNNNQLHKIEAKGSGLGLKLCYEFVEAVGGEIFFKTNNNGQGVQAKITL